MIKLYNCPLLSQHFDSVFNGVSHTHILSKDLYTRLLKALFDFLDRSISDNLIIIIKLIRYNYKFKILFLSIKVLRKYSSCVKIKLKIFFDIPIGNKKS